MISKFVIPRLCINIKKYLKDHFEDIGRGPEERLEEDKSCLGRFFENKHDIFKAKAQTLLNSFNFAMVEAIMSHHFPKTINAIKSKIIHV